MINIKLKYGILSVVFLVENYHLNQLTSITEIANKENLSIKFLEQIFIKLKKAEIVKSIRGKYGGYILNKNPANFTAFDVIKALEEDISVANCICNGMCNKECSYCKCRCNKFWYNFEENVTNYFKSRSIQEIYNSSK